MLFLFLFGLHVLTEDSHTECLRPPANSAAGGVHLFLPDFGEQVGRKRDLREGRAPPQMIWGTLNEALSKLTSKAGLVPASITLATVQSTMP
jgi:hypothetical protein